MRQNETLSLHSQLFLEMILSMGTCAPPNILLKGSKPYLLDFEWAGVLGEATYPDNVNSDYGKWHEGVQP